MAWRTTLDPAAARALRKLDKVAARRITDFIDNRLQGVDDPRALGGPLQGKIFAGLWRYRVGDYRLIARIKDEVVTIMIVEIGHRSEVYRGRG